MASATALRSREGVEVRVTEGALGRLAALRGCPSGVVPVDVDARTLERVVAACESGWRPGPSDATEDVVRVLSAAAYLDFPPLQEAACVELTERLRGRSAAEMREALGIPDDMTADEAAAARGEFSWAFPPPPQGG